MEHVKKIAVLAVQGAFAEQMERVRMYCAQTEDGSYAGF